MARGGRRAGAPGRNYPNRTDLTLPAQVAPGGTYGTRQQLEAAQRAIPLPTAQAPAPAVPPPAVTPPNPTPAGGGAPQVDFMRPTERPNEPVTTGLPVGPGGGSEALGMGPGMASPDTLGAQLRAMYQMAPNNDLLRLIELHDRGF